MRYATISLLILAVSMGIPAPAASGEVGEFPIRSVTPLGETPLARLRQLAKDDPEAAARAAAARADAEPLIGKTPEPLAAIHYQGLVNTEPKRIASVEKLRQMDDVAALVRYWQISNDEAAAKALRKHVSAWAATYIPTGNEVNENKLYPLIVAYHHTRDGFSDDDRRRIDAWLQRLGALHEKAVRKSTCFTNLYTKHVRLVAVIGGILGKPEWQATAEDGLKRFVSNSLRTDGTSLDLERRDTLTYHASALRPAIELAMLPGERGPALYAWESPAGGSIKKSVDYLVPYALGEKTRQEWTHSKSELDHDRAARGLEKYRQGRLYDPQDALDVMQEACFFDLDLKRVVQHLTGSKQRFPTWQMLVNEAVRTEK